jgi:hypothetical protein
MLPLGNNRNLFFNEAHKFELNYQQQIHFASKPWNTFEWQITNISEKVQKVSMQYAFQQQH